MVPLLPLRDGVRALPISFFRQSMPSFYMNAPDCICSPGRLPLGAFCTGRDDQAVAFRLARSAISIHAPRVGRDAGWAIRCIHYSISIHAPRAGCDPFCAESHSVFWISIHAPRAGCDGGLLLSEKAAAEFQSTHPVRGAAIGILNPRWCSRFQSTHPVRGATAYRWLLPSESTNFNPRTPCGVRLVHGKADYPVWDFNPRTPCGVRRAAACRRRHGPDFNPRTPCGVRQASAVAVSFARYFNPRTPCGVRLCLGQL